MNIIHKILKLVSMKSKNTSLDPLFSDSDEKLFRAIIPVDAFWDSDSNRPSSGAFKDKNGLSVDRQAGRDKMNAIAFLLATKREDSKIVSITVQKCREIDVCPKYKPIEDNIYHSEIHDSENKVLISRGKCRTLANNVTIEK